MRPRIACTGLVLAFGMAALPAAAQTPISAGPMGGVSIFTFSGSDASEFGDLGADVSKSNRVGFLVGAFAEFEIGDVLSLEPQLLWVQKGAKYNVDVTGASGSATIKLDYVQIPVLLKAEYRQEGKDLAPSVFAGPAVGFKTSCSVNIEADGASGSQDCDSDAVNGTEWSVIFGLGLDYKRIVFQARYDLGLSGVPQDSDVDVKNGGWAFTLGYAFAIK